MMKMILLMVIISVAAGLYLVTRSIPTPATPEQKAAIVEPTMGHKSTDSDAGSYKAFTDQCMARYRDEKKLAMIPAEMQEPLLKVGRERCEVQWMEQKQAAGAR